MNLARKPVQSFRKPSFSSTIQITQTQQTSTHPQNSNPYNTPPNHHPFPHISHHIYSKL